MTEADALARARALLAEPTPRSGSAIAALALAALVTCLAVGLVGVTVMAPAQATEAVSSE